MGTADAIPPMQTYHAGQAREISELVNLKFSNRPFGTSVRRYLRVRGLDTLSTDAGRKARQAIVLVPESDAHGASLMCGWLDSGRRIAELRTFAFVEAQHVARFHEKSDLTPVEYDRAIADLETYLASQAYTVSNVETTRTRGTGLRLSSRPSPSELPSDWAERDPSYPTPVLDHGARRWPESWTWLTVAAITGFALCYGLVLLGIIG